MEDEWTRVKTLLTDGQYEEVGQLGALVKTFDDLGIPWDIMVIYSINDRKPRSIGIVIPPNRDEDKVSVFGFHNNYNFDCVYVENALPLGYQVKKEDDQEEEDNNNNDDDLNDDSMRF